MQEGSDGTADVPTEEARVYEFDLVLPTADLAAYDLVLLDTRNREEVGHGSFAGALTLPIDNFTDLPAALEIGDGEVVDLDQVHGSAQAALRSRTGSGPWPPPIRGRQLRRPRV